MKRVEDARVASLKHKKNRSYSRSFRCSPDKNSESNWTEILDEATVSGWSGKVKDKAPFIYLADRKASAVAFFAPLAFNKQLLTMNFNFNRSVHCALGGLFSV